MEFFVPPEEEQQWYDYWRKARYDWYLNLGLNPDRLRMARARDRRVSSLLHGNGGHRVSLPIWLG